MPRKVIDTLNAKIPRLVAQSIFLKKELKWGYIRKITPLNGFITLFGRIRRLCKVVMYKDHGH